MANENTTAHTEAPGAPHKGAFPPFDKQTFPSQLFWLAICFIALYLITARLVQPRVAGIIEARRNRIAQDLAEASRHKQDSEAALAAYEKALADARARAQAIAGETRDRLHADADSSRKVLEEELNARLTEAERTIEATKRTAMTNVRGIAIEAAGEIVNRLAGVRPTEPAVAAAVDAVLKR